MIDISKAKPILFTTKMVRAILAERKSMTRRVIKSQPDHVYDYYTGSWECDTCGHCHLCEPKPPYQPGDILWVRETWFKNEECLLYKASKYEKTKAYHGRNGWVQIKWRPSIFMPREAARIFLRVTNVRAERLQEISAHECVLEGIDTGDILLNTPKDGNFAEYAKEQFKRLWDSLNEKRGYGWDTNPWVWVIEFERVNNI